VHDFERQTGAPCALTVADGSSALPAETQAALYRVTQEALTNARTHARPKRVRVNLRCPPGRVELVVEDEAERVSGAPGRDAPLGHGLAGMRERAQLLGGELTAASTESGFRVEVVLPR
jgi:signal transduction histidine kinase